MVKIHGYINSHIYELHALIAATITLFILYRIKDRVKHSLDAFVDRQARFDEKWMENRKLYQHRSHMVLILLVFVIAFFLFGIIAFLSPFIRFSFYNAVLSGVICLTEYALIDQLCIGERRDL